MAILGTNGRQHQARLVDEQPSRWVAATEIRSITRGSWGGGELLGFVLRVCVLIAVIAPVACSQDPWERDNAAAIRSILDEAARLAPTDQRAALLKYSEFAELVGRRAIQDEDLKRLVDSARERHRTLDAEYRAELARQEGESKRLADEAQEAAKRDEQARAEAAQRRSEAAKKQADAKARASWLPAADWDGEQSREKARRDQIATDDSAHGPEEQARRREAYEKSQYFVKQKLRSPRTATFPEYEHPHVVVRTPESAGGTYVVAAWVESDNGRGAAFQQRFVCKLQEKDEYTWVCTEVTLE